MTRIEIALVLALVAGPAVLGFAVNRWLVVVVPVALFAILTASAMEHGLFAEEGVERPANELRLAAAWLLSIGGVAASALGVLGRRLVQRRRARERADRSPARTPRMTR